jgi:hypothetical protein
LYDFGAAALRLMQVGGVDLPLQFETVQNMAVGQSGRCLMAGRSSATYWFCSSPAFWTASTVIATGRTTLSLADHLSAGTRNPESVGDRPKLLEGEEAETRLPTVRHRGDVRMPDNKQARRLLVRAVTM